LIVEKAANDFAAGDFALDRQASGQPADKAILSASKARIRAILMTTICAMLGSLPLILSRSAGSELRQPLGTILLGGLAMAQILTTFSTPVIYCALARLSKPKIKGENIHQGGKFRWY